MLSVQVVLFTAIYVLWRIVPSVAFSWQLNAAPVQCTEISIIVTGTDGRPPYNVLVVPFGPSPSQNGVEVREIVQKNFDGNSNSVNVPIKYPANTQFVAVVSDSTGFGTGGTSAPTLVGESGDNSCFNSSKTGILHFWFYIGPPTESAAQVIQCSTTRIWWNNTADVVGTPTFVAVIPGGISFNISQGSSITNTSDEGIGFSWLPHMREGTQFMVVGSDDRGSGTGGMISFTIGHSDDSSCVVASSPGITPGAVTSANKSTRNMIGGAVGGSVGLALCVAAAFFYIRRRRHRKLYSIISEPPDDMTQPKSHVEPFATIDLASDTRTRR